MKAEKIQDGKAPVPYFLLCGANQIGQVQILKAFLMILFHGKMRAKVLCDTEEEATVN